MLKFKLYENGDITYSRCVGNINHFKSEKANEMLTLEEKLILEQNKEQGRVYYISKGIRRLIISASLKLVREAKFKVIFFTYTFAFSADEKTHQTIFLNHLKNLSTNYVLQQYIWTKEFQKSGKIHYHSLFDLPYINIQSINDSFNSSVRNYNSSLATSNNSVRLPAFKNRSVVKNGGSMAKYIAKYLSKSGFSTFKLPAYCISKGLFPLFTDITEQEVIQMQREMEYFIPFACEEFGVISLKGYI